MPDRFSLAAVRSAAAACRGCPLYAEATQTVFGDGKLTSEVMLVGEQPGDQEDLAGEPFVGPAGTAARPGARGGRYRPRAGPT